MASMQFRLHLAIGAVVSLLVLVHGATNPQDVNALTSLYISLNKPPQLTNWNATGGDPCGENWLGVTCSGTNVTELNLNKKSISGTLGFSLGDLHDLLILDFSNNNIGGNIPYQLPSSVQTMNFGGNQLTGNIPYSLQQLTNIKKLDLSHNQLSNGIPDLWASLNTSLQTLDLSYNALTGPLPSTIGNLSALTYLDVSYNHLQGDLPLSLSNLINLQTLILENNSFTGWLPPGLHPSTLKIGGNNFNIAPAPPPPPSRPPPPGARPPPPHRAPPRQKSPSPSPPSPGGSGKIGFWTAGRITGIAFTVLLAIVAVILCVLFFSHRKHKEPRVQGRRRTWLRPLIPIGLTAKSKQGNYNSGEIGAFNGVGGKTSPLEHRKESPPLKSEALKAPPSFKMLGEKGPMRPPPSRPPPTRSVKVLVPAEAYSVADLQAATNSFAQENLIGEGSLGRVYRGEFPDGQVFAVKKLDTSSPLVQNEEDFLKILAGMARLRHANVTELVGYCVEHGQRLLVYQYISRGTLNEILHTTDETTKRLSWNARVKVALGAARALEYLHEVCLPAVVHRNFKSANVLLDDELNPHLTDCGIAALTPLGSDRQVSAQMLGSFGYSAPEFAMSGLYTVKSDVYSFGVVMLELLTGRKPLDSTRIRAEQSLVRWATPQLHDIDALAKMVDPALKGIYPAKSLSRFADIIALCVQPEPEFRPPMSEVVQALVRLMQRASLNKRRSGEDLGASNRSTDRHDPSDSST